MAWHLATEKRDHPVISRFHGQPQQGMHSMPIVRLIRPSRKVLTLGLIGLIAFLGGCDGGSTGESSITPPTAPPGRSGEDRAKAKAAFASQRAQPPNKAKKNAR